MASSSLAPQRLIGSTPGTTPTFQQIRGAVSTTLNAFISAGQQRSLPEHYLESQVSRLAVAKLFIPKLAAMLPDHAYLERKGPCTFAITLVRH
jgi:hypothetical protein